MPRSPGDRDAGNRKEIADSHWPHSRQGKDRVQGTVKGKKKILIGALALIFSGDTLATLVLSELHRQTKISYEIGKESLHLANEKIKLTPDPKSALAMAEESLRKVKDDYQNHIRLHAWDMEGYQKAMELSKINKHLYRLSSQGAKEAAASKKDMLEGIQTAKNLNAVQKRGLGRARWMQKISEELLPYSELISKMLP